MKSTENNKEFPYQNGTSIKGANTNNFEGRVAEAVQEELDTSLFLSWIGEQYYNFSQAFKRKEVKEYQLLEQTQLEKESESKKLLKRHLGVKPNPLRYATKFKVYFNYLGVALGMLGEFFIYQSIAENAFKMPLFKSYLTGLLVLLFTKFVQVAILKHIKEWIKENNLLFRTVHKTMIFVLVALVFLNAMMMGITNLNEIDRQNKIEQMEYVSASIADAEEFGEGTTELETELTTLQKEINGEEGGFFAIAKFISIAFIGLLAIGAGATLFVIADLYNDALKIKKRLEELLDRQAEHRANFSYFLKTYDDLIFQQKGIIQLFGQKHFLEKLLSKEREEDLKVKA